jgi:membrane protein implicated in regulation of membrane protease activity
VDSPESWRWIWMVAAFLFTVGEMASPGSFFLFPFAAGALVAAVLAFAGVSAGAFAALRPIARRLDQGGPAAGIGANRLIGETAIVLDSIGPGDLGLIRVDREEWRAESLDGSPIAAGTPVRVVEVRGTRAVVWPTALDEPDRPALG